LAEKERQAWNWQLESQGCECSLLVAKPLLVSTTARVCQNKLELGRVSRKIVIIGFVSLCSRTNSLGTKKDHQSQFSAPAVSVTGCLAARRNLTTSNCRNNLIGQTMNDDFPKHEDFPTTPNDAKAFK